MEAAPRSLEVLTQRRPVPWLPIILVAAVLAIALGGVVLLVVRGFGAAPVATVAPVTIAPPSATTGVMTSTATFTPVPTRAATATFTPTPPATPTIPPPIQYTVQEGDTLLALAQRFDVSVEAIKAANPDLEGDFIVAGQNIVIPRPTPGPTAAPGETLTPTEPAVVTVEHTVQAGETLSDIAQFYGISVDEIKAANPDLEDDIVIAGQTLLIPLGTPTPTPSPTPGPTSTATPRPQYEAPPLLNPPDGAAYVLEPDAAVGFGRAAGHAPAGPRQRMVPGDAARHDDRRRSPAVLYSRDVVADLVRSARKPAAGQRARVHVAGTGGARSQPGAGRHAARRRAKRAGRSRAHIPLGGSRRGDNCPVTEYFGVARLCTAPRQMRT
jgi:LysM repeat protein